jgi:hypothetical protein
MQRIAAAKIAFGKTEVVYGIQQIGFAGSVAAADANDALVKPVVLEIVILELKKRYGLKG